MGMHLKRLFVFSFCFIAAMAAASFAFAEELQVDWVAGPSTPVMGDNLAEIELPEGYIFAGAEDTMELMQYMGNPPTDLEVGLITPNADNESWFLVFEYDPVGYVRDDDKDEIDADAIFESYSKGTEAANKIREKNGQPKIHLKEWVERPFYDESTHNLTWAFLIEGEDGTNSVNYNTRVLGRHGYMSVTLVTDPSELEVAKANSRQVMTTFRYTEGKDYLSFVKGDKVAKYGLTALIAAGAGAAAVKTGLLAALLKYAKAIVISVGAVIALLFNKIKGLLGFKSSSAKDDSE
jgi:uncharacterized membrane-anchored protein